MSVLEQMQLVEALVRRPHDLEAARERAGPEDAALLATLDPGRLEAFSRVQAELLCSRWWEPRFPAVLAALDPDLPRRLIASSRFEEAVGEDETAAAFVHGLLDLLEAGALPDAPPWLAEMLAYEYVLSVALPRRAAGATVSPGLEARLFAEQPASWFHGGLLRGTVLAVWFAWPVSALREGDDEVELPDEPGAPQPTLFYVEGDEVIEVETSDEAADALDLLQGGAGWDAIEAALGPEPAAELRGWLEDAGLVAGSEG